MQRAGAVFRRPAIDRLERLREQPGQQLVDPVSYLFIHRQIDSSCRITAATSLLPSLLQRGSNLLRGLLRREPRPGNARFSQQRLCTASRLKRANLRELPVTPADLERIVSAAEAACAVAVTQPTDASARQRLHEALAPLVSPAVPGEDPEFAHLHDLFAQARVWADIVRTRIAGFETNRRSDPLGLAIRYPARDLLSILTDLLRELRRTRDA